MSERDSVLDAESALTGGEEQNFDISADLIRGHINTIILRSLYDGDKSGYEIIYEIEKKRKRENDAISPEIRAKIQEMQMKALEG